MCFGSSVLNLLGRLAHGRRLGWLRGVIRLVTRQQDPLALSSSRSSRTDKVRPSFTAVPSVPISASIIHLADQLDYHPPLRGTRQLSASSVQKASHFLRRTSQAVISAMAFSLRCSFYLRTLISRWFWARSLSSSFCLAIVSSGSALASSDYGTLAMVR